MDPTERFAVLFVDDEPEILHALQRCLRKEKFQSHFAGSGTEALEVMEKIPIQVIVSDLQMPEMDGMQLISRIKYLYPEVIRIILSATRDIDQTIDSINTGEVFRFVPKPIEPESFRQILRNALEYYKVKTERQRLLTELSKANAYLENALHTIRRADAEKENMAREAREVERRIEEHLLQSDAPAAIAGATIAATSIPSTHLDGDFFDFIELGKDTFDLIIADVMGKGIQSALVGAGIRSMILKKLAQNNYTTALPPGHREYHAAQNSISPVLAGVHDLAIAKLQKLKMFVTLCYARFDLARLQISFIDCGHTKTIHYRQSTGYAGFLEGENLPLGLIDHADYSEITVTLERGDTLLFYSDGVTEAEDNKGECFGAERLMQILKTNESLSPDELVKKVKAGVIEFTSSQVFADDFSCIAVRID